MSKTRMGKRVASLLLSLVMMLSLLPTTVYAEGADTGDTTDEIVGQATTSGDNTEGTGEPEPTGEGEDGSANVTEGEDGAATNDAVVEETIAPVNAEGVDAVANAESSGDEASGEDESAVNEFDITTGNVEIAAVDGETYTIIGGGTETANTAVVTLTNGTATVVLNNVNATSDQFKGGVFVADVAAGAVLYLELDGTNVLNNTTSYGSAAVLQKTGAGKLVICDDNAVAGSLDAEATGKTYGAAIGGSNYSDENGTIGSIEISGGTVTAVASYGAAIGTGGEYSIIDSIVISGGDVTATVSNARYGAAIGGGQYGEVTAIEIPGGKVTATAGYGAGIGSGAGSTSTKSIVGTISITNGNVIAESCSGGAGIGGGSGKSATVNSIAISGGTITATSRTYQNTTGAAIGGAKGSVGTIAITAGDVTVQYKSGTIQPGTICVSAGMAEGSTTIASGVVKNADADNMAQYIGDNEYDPATGEIKPKATASAVAKIGETTYETLQAAFDGAATGDTVTLLTDITLTEQVNITKALDGLTLDGNNKTITCATATDPLSGGRSALYFGNADSKLYCTGIKIKNLTMTGTARFAIFLCGGTTTEFTNVNISGNYYIAVNLYGTHGATMTNCNISNSTTGTDKYISGVWSNVASQNPLKLVNSKAGVIAINTYTTANTLAPKIFIDKDSSAEIHTFDDGSVSSNKKLCVSTESTGTYTIKEYDETTGTWAEIVDYVAAIGDNKYESLADAIAAAKDGQTVTLLADCSGDGIVVAKDKFTNQGLTVDFGGHSYTVGGKLVGSSGTMSNGFQLNKNNKITFQNGAIYGDASVAGDDTTSWSGAPAILIQNYCDLTLSGMKVSGGSNTVYTMSNNCGNVVIENTTINASRGSSNRAPFALDACGYSDYTGVSVTVKGTSAINGDIEVSRSAKNKNAVTLTLESGTVNGKLKIDSSIKSGDATTVTKSNAVNVAAPAGYVWDNGTLAAAVAQIGETGYASLQAAIDAVKSGETIKLLQNVDLGTDNCLSAKSTAENVTIDLGNHAVTSAYKNFTLYLKVTNWTIQNGTIKNTNTGAYGTLAVTTRPSSATLKGLTVESATNGVYVKIASGFDNIVASITVEDRTKISGDQYGVYMEGQPRPHNKIRNGQEILNVNGGEITGKTAAIAVFGAEAGNTKAGVTVNINGGKVYSEGFAIAGGGATLRENTTINISGGEVISTKDTAIYHPQAGTVTISGGEVYGVTGGVQMCAGTLNVTGGTISATGNGDVSGKTGDGSIPDGAAVSIVNRAYPAGAPTMTISGGTFTSAAGVGAVQAYGWKNNSQQTWDKPNASVSGGTFSSAVPAEYCAEGFIPTKNTDNTYGVKQVVYVAETNNVKYETLQAAINAAARNATVTMLADTRENVAIGKALTLDLNGFTLNGSTGERKPALTITARTVTIKDSSEAQTGTIMREDTAENSGVSSHYVIDIQGNAWVMFESGNVKNDSGNAEGKGASLVRVGNDSIAEYPGLNIKGGTFTQNNFIVIKVDRGDLFLNGGTLNSANSYAIEDWHRATVKGGTVNGTVAAWTYNSGHNSDLTISGGTVNGNVESVSYDGAEGKLAKVKITGGTVNGTLSTKRYNNATAPSKDMATIEVTGGTFDKDPSKYVVEGSTVKKNSDNKYGVEKAYLAKVGETSYYTMDEAFKAQTASGEDIVMLRDYTTGSAFSSGSINRTVDLRGHTWTCTGTDANSAAFEINNPNAMLTVKNGKIVSSQLVGLIPSAMGGTIKYDNSSLTFENVEMSTTATSGIETNGNNTNDTVTLKNSTLNVPNGFGIYFPSSGTLTINNSTINAKTMGVQVCAGSLSISGDQTAITVSGDAVHKTENDGAIQDGAAISVVNRTGYKGLDKIEVTGGTFKANGTNEAIKAYNWENTNNVEKTFTANDKVFVSGGSFSSAVPEGLCATGYISVANADGTHTVKKGVYVAKVDNVKYESLQAAIDAANADAIVTLLADVTENVTIAAGQSITLDLNGFTLNGGTGTAKAALRNLGTITIRDTSAAKTGTIKRDDTGIVGETSYYVIDNQGTMTIESGTVINNSGYRQTSSIGSMNGSSLIRNGDDSAGTLTITGGTFTQKNFIAIKNGSLGTLNVSGGTISSNHSAIQNWFKADITGGEIEGQLWTDAWEADSTGHTVISGDAEFTGEIVMDITGEVVPQLEIKGGKLDVSNWRITTTAADAGAKPAVSGGTFKAAVPADYCAPGYVPTDKDADGRYTVAEGKFTVQVTSRTVSSASPVANVSGGGRDIKYATGTTVTAASLSGYTFKGWFVNEYTDKSEAASTDLSFTYKPTADCTLVAVYEPISGAKFYLTVNASEFTVGESAVYDSYMHDQVAAGESVTVTFKGTENFLYWVNASRKVVSTNPAYTFIMGSETTLSAVYGKTREAQATVVFMSDSDQIITSKAYNSGTAIQFPTPPIKMGCTFEAWSMTEKEIQDAIAASNNGVIVVKACYTDPSTPYTVTVQYPDGIEAETIQGVVGKTVTVTAKEISGKTFSYWTDSENNVLGYTKTLMLAPSGNITVKAVYSDTAVEAKPVITMTAVEAGEVGTGYYVISFTATRAVPEGYTVVKQGILYSVDSQCSGEGAKDYMKLTDEGSVPAGIYVYEGNNTELSGVTRFNAKTGAVDRTIYGRGYMVLKNSSGTIEYVYSDNILPGNYSNLANIGG